MSTHTHTARMHAHTHARTHARTNARTHARTHARTQTLSHMHTRTLSLFLSLSLSQTHTVLHFVSSFDAHPLASASIFFLTSCKSSILGEPVISLHTHLAPNCRMMAEIDSLVGPAANTKFTHAFASFAMSSARISLGPATRLVEWPQKLSVDAPWVMCMYCCNTLQHTATLCNTLQHTAPLCNTLQHSATLCNTLNQHCNTSS